ncbi:hypothetical protein [Pedobacter soli]|uniref:Uncharacterized protein n=1 Tax=Pedobacter soli TaxID=390242 RepID=A0A1G6ZDP3_9SPHI|nr:hypothetical protein [Pedobacter soli]SDE00759.1 hypothetical protein SAMN04488024_11070 [Pedobacter soli]
MLNTNTLSARKAFRLPFNFYLIGLLFALVLGCKQSEEGKIHEVCSTFISGRIALRYGDSLKLKSVMEDSLFRLFMLNEQYIKVVDAPTMRPNLDIYPTKVTINGNRATCKMSGDEFYYINLIKKGDRWIVIGENEIYASPDKLLAIRKKIRKYQLFLVDKPARDSVMRIMDIFRPGLEPAFKDNNFKYLESVSDRATVDFIRKFFDYAKRRSGVPLLTAEIDSHHVVAGDVSFKGNQASFKFYQEEVSIALKKIEDEYVVTGFNHMDSKDISPSVMEKHYMDLLRVLELVRQKEFRNKAIK